MAVASPNVGKTVLFENDRIRAWDMVLEPGESSELHHHRHDYMFIYVTPTQLELFIPGQERFRRSYRDGFVQYSTVGHEGLTHQITNVGNTTHRQIIVELLGPSATAVPSEPETNGRWQ